jgi:hypothetical protein
MKKTTIGDREGSGVMAHTPGPWTIVDGVVTCPDGLPLYTGMRPKEEDEANALLIAAAPDLLAACKAASDALYIWLENPEEEAVWIELDAAIARAEGRR